MDVVEAAWYKVSGGAEQVPVARVKEAYDASRHPRVLDGVMSVGQAQEVVARAFDTVPDGVVTWAEFLQYHVKMSAEVDRGRSVDRDGTFVGIVVQQWSLDKDPNSAMQPTGIIPSTLECPKGLKRTQNMHLVWADASGNAGPKALIGFKAAVKTRFARGDLPAEIRGHFAFPDEVADYTLKGAVARSALLSPLSIVWRDEATGAAKGFKEVVSQNIDLAQLPETLRAFVLPHTDAEAVYGAVEWLTLAEPYNPMYKKSSEAFGEAAEESAKDVLTLKRKVWEGTNCGLAWHGHTGKFTDGFNGGPGRASGLNTATTRSIV